MTIELVAPRPATVRRPAAPTRTSAQPTPSPVATWAALAALCAIFTGASALASTPTGKYSESQCSALAHSSDAGDRASFIEHGSHC